MNTTNKLIVIYCAIVLTAIGTNSGIAQPLGQWRLLNPAAAYTVRTNPLDGNKILVGNWANQLYRSDDGGTTWYIVETGETSATNWLSSVCVTRQDTSVVIVGGFQFTGLKRGVSNGKFEVVLIDSNFRPMMFIAEAIVEGLNGTFYAARGATYHSVWRSTDIGNTWDSIAVIPKDETTRLLCMAAHPTIPDLLFIGGTKCRIYRSSDAGITWESVPVLNGEKTMYDGTEVSMIRFSPTNPMVGYAAITIIDRGTKNDGGILKTTDGGLNWDRVAFPDTSFWAVSVRTLPNGKEEVVAGGFRQRTSQPGEVIGDSLVYRSLDGGATWEQYKNIEWVISDPSSPICNVWTLHVAPADNKLYMGTEQGIYVMDDVSGIAQEHRSAKAGLSLSSLPGKRIRISGLYPQASDATWSVYSMSGTKVAAGTIDVGQAQTLSLPNCAAGMYMLVWGSDRSYRTVPFMLEQ